MEGFTMFFFLLFFNRTLRIRHFFCLSLITFRIRYFFVYHSLHFLHNPTWHNKVHLFFFYHNKVHLRNRILERKSFLRYSIYSLITTYRNTNLVSSMLDVILMISCFQGTSVGQFSFPLMTSINSLEST